VASTPTASSGDLDALQSALLEAHQDASMKSVMDDLLLERFTRPDPSSYAALRDRFEAAARYWAEHPFAAVTHPAFLM
jgi:hypothetical protein